MIVAGTGHRPPKLGGYGEKVYEQLVELAIWALRSFVNPPTQVISGMAIGWDQALAEAAIHHGMPLVAAIPCIGQELRWPAEAQARYHYILSRASEKHLVSNIHYQPWVMHRRNMWMVDRANVMLALWDGSQGGTSNCLEYAKVKRVPILNLWRPWLTRQALPAGHLDLVELVDLLKRADLKGRPLSPREFIKEGEARLYVGYDPIDHTYLLTEEYLDTLVIFGRVAVTEADLHSWIGRGRPAGI